MTREAVIAKLAPTLPVAKLYGWAVVLGKRLYGNGVEGHPKYGAGRFNGDVLTSECVFYDPDMRLAITRKTVYLLQDPHPDNADAGAR